MIDYLLVLVVSLLTCAGQLCQKKATDGWQSSAKRTAASWLSLALLLLGLAMLLWLRLLQSMPLSQAYPLLSVNFIFITLAGQYFFHEPVTSRHWCGIATIILGIFLLNWHGK